jgi:hypothetical protein
MTLNNGKRIMLLRLTAFITTVVYVLYIFLAYFPKIFRNAMSEESLTALTVAVTVVYLLLLFWPVIRQYSYLFFSADEKTVTLRWYTTGLMPGESKSIEIPSGRFAGYEITTKGMGLYHYITLYQQVQGKRAAYPPVCITALSKGQRELMEPTLKNYKSAG